MLKVLIWVVSKDARFFQDAVTILKRQHDGIDIIGEVAGKDIINSDQFVRGAFDVLLVVGARQIGMSKIVTIARQLKLPEEKLLGDWIVCVPGFKLDKYRRLQRSRMSIISRQCFGGCISHMLGLPFRSPFVNLFIRDGDFIKFLHAPRVYIEAEPRFEKLIGTSDEAPDGFPLLSLADISLNMMHYPTPKNALAKWNERKRRINWFNLFVIMSTKDENILRGLDELPYGRKVCFVPFKSDLDSAWYIKPDFDKQAKSFSDVVNRFGWGNFFYYDLFDMLLYGKKTPLIDM